MHHAYIIPINPAKQVLRAEIAQQTAEFYRNGGREEVLPGFVEPAPKRAVERKPIPTTPPPRYVQRSNQNQHSVGCPPDMYSIRAGWEAIRNLGFKIPRDTFYRICDTDSGPVPDAVVAGKDGREFKFYSYETLVSWLDARKEARK